MKNKIISEIKCNLPKQSKPIQRLLNCSEFGNSKNGINTSEYTYNDCLKFRGLARQLCILG